eukprot:11228998-Ditylum_brightwellii.AAC.1
MDLERMDDELLEFWEKLNSEDEGESINAGIETIQPVVTPEVTYESMADDIASDLTDDPVADIFDVDPALVLEVYNAVVVE